MSNVINEIVGYKKFGDKIDITDPCHNRDILWRMNNISIVPGDYECSIKYDEDIKRVLKIGIYLNTEEDFDIAAMDRIGEVGVDAGMAGFFENKPDFNLQQWIEFCDVLSIKEHAWLTDMGFWSRSGFGDGGYAVYAYLDESKSYSALEIEFVCGEEE